MLFLSAILFVLAQFCWSCQSFFLISPFCTQFHHFALSFTFCTGEIALITNLGLIDVFSANQTAEIVACILLSLIPTSRKFQSLLWGEYGCFLELHNDKLEANTCKFMELFEYGNSF